MKAHITVTAKDLGIELANHNVCLLIGSGVSCACGLPSWKALIDEMKRKLRDTCPAAERDDLNQFFKTSDPTTIAGTFKRNVGDITYIRFLRERFRHQSFTVAPILKLIPAFPSRVIFTTNFDKLLETVCRNKNGESPVVITHPHQFSGLNGTELRIIKVHGDIDYPDTITLTDQDYLKYNEKCESIKTYLQGQIAFSNIILIGFGLKDPNFEKIYAGAKLLVPAAAPRVVAIMAQQNQWDVKRWQDDGLVINNFTDFADVPKYLRAALKAYKNVIA